MKLTLAFIAAVALTLTGCNKKTETAPPKTVESPTVTTTPSPAAAVTVSSVTLGNAINPQKQVVTASDTFAKGDTIYASVNTTGSGSSTLKAKWTYNANGQDVLVSESTQPINATGPASTEFHVSKPDGWPTGDYKVEITASGNSPTTRTFTVK
jgi:hypothetical protein